MMRVAAGAARAAAAAAGGSIVRPLVRSFVRGLESDLDIGFSLASHRIHPV